MLNVIDEFAHESLAIRVRRKLKRSSSLTCLPIYSSNAVCQGTFGLTMDLSS